VREEEMRARARAKDTRFGAEGTRWRPGWHGIRQGTPGSGRRRTR